MGCTETIIPHTLLCTALIPDLEIGKSRCTHGHTLKVVLISEVQVTCFPQPAALKTPPVEIKIKQRTPEAHYDAKEWSCTTTRPNAGTRCETAPSELSLLFSRLALLLFIAAPDDTLEDHRGAQPLLLPRSSSKMDSFKMSGHPVALTPRYQAHQGRQERSLGVAAKKQSPEDKYDTLCVICVSRRTDNAVLVSRGRPHTCVSLCVVSSGSEAAGIRLC